MKKLATLLAFLFLFSMVQGVAAKEVPATNKGFHAGVGLGPSGDTKNGIGFQLKLGYNFGNDWRVFFYHLNHYYTYYMPKYDEETRLYTDDEVTEIWNSGLNGVGFDYFLMPAFAVRAAFGLGSDTMTWQNKTHRQAIDDFDDNTPYKDVNRYGLAWSFGGSLRLAGNADHSFSIDPSMVMVQYVPEGWTHATSRNIFFLTFNYNFR